MAFIAIAVINHIGSNNDAVLARKLLLVSGLFSLGSLVLKVKLSPWLSTFLEF